MSYLSRLAARSTARATTLAMPKGVISRTADPAGEEDVQMLRRMEGEEEAKPLRRQEEEEEAAQPLRRQEEEEAAQAARRQEEEEEEAQALRRQAPEEEEAAQTARRQEEEEEEAQTLRRQGPEEEEAAQAARRQDEEEAQALRRQEEEEAQPLHREVEEESMQALRRQEEEEEAMQALRRQEEQQEEGEMQTLRRRGIAGPGDAPIPEETRDELAPPDALAMRRDLGSAPQMGVTPFEGMPAADPIFPGTIPKADGFTRPKVQIDQIDVLIHEPARAPAAPSAAARSRSIRARYLRRI